MTTSTEDTHEAEQRPEVFAPFEEETPKDKRAHLKLLVAVAVAALGIGGAIGMYVHQEQTLTAANKRIVTAEAKLKTAQDQLKVKPKTVEKTIIQNVPTFGRSVLMGVFASGAIQTGVYDGSGNFTMTPNDSTCSMEYTQLSNQYTSIAIDRAQFMSACEASLTTTTKKDDTP